MRRNIDLAHVTWQALEGIASQEGCSVNDLVRDAVKRDLYRRTRAKKAGRPDERLVAPLRALLADDCAYAQGWEDLRSRLHHKGYELRESGGGLALFEQRSGRKLCKASDLGYSLSRLSQRFGQLFPGHSHAYLSKRLGISHSTRF